MGRNSEAYCEHGQIVQESRQMQGNTLHVNQRIASSCMFHALSGLCTIRNENELLGKCPAEKGDAFGMCRKTVKYVE